MDRGREEVVREANTYSGEEVLLKTSKGGRDCERDEMDRKKERERDGAERGSGKGVLTWHVKKNI